MIEVRRSHSAFSLPVALCNSSRSADESALFKTHESRIQSAHVEPNRPTRYLLESGRNGIPVLRAKRRKRLQNHEIECALQDLRFFVMRHTKWSIFVSIRLSNGSSCRKMLMTPALKNLWPESLSAGA